MSLSVSFARPPWFLDVIFGPFTDCWDVWGDELHRIHYAWIISGWRQKTVARAAKRNLILNSWCWWKGHGLIKKSGVHPHESRNVDQQPGSVFLLLWGQWVRSRLTFRAVYLAYRAAVNLSVNTALRGPELNAPVNALSHWPNTQHFSGALDEVRLVL